MKKAARTLAAWEGCLVLSVDQAKRSSAGARGVGSLKYQK